MRKILFILFVLYINAVYCQDFNYERKWGSYYGSNSQRINATAIDSQGNLYLAGSTYGILPFVSHFTHQSQLSGNGDGFIIKLNAAGEVVWGTYFGGGGEDGISSMAVDGNNHLYVSGRTNSTTGIADTAAYQPNLAGGADAFLAKFTTDGEKIWSTYYGSVLNDGAESNAGTGIVTDDSGQIYICTTTQSPDMATTGAFQTVPIRDSHYYMIAKFDSVGHRLWSTYYGGSNYSEINTIAINATGLYVAGFTQCMAQPADLYFGTPGAHKPEPSGCADAFLSKFSFDGQRLWSTYYGGETPGDIIKGNNLKCFGNDVYLSGYTVSNTNIATTGAYQENRESAYTPFLVKFTDEGVRLWGTYCGTGNASGINFCNTGIDHEGNVYLCGTTSHSGNIATVGSYQPVLASSRDSFMVKFNPDGERLWGTYYGGERDDLEGQIVVGDDGFYFVGQTLSSTGISTENGLQPTPIFGEIRLNVSYITRFDELPLGVNDIKDSTVSIYPNPAKEYFQLQLKENKDCNIIVYNALGQVVLKRAVVNGEMVDVSGLSKGVYYVNVFANGQNYQKKLAVQ